VPKNVKLSAGFVLVILCFIGAAISILPPPDGVNAKAFPMFGVFVSVIIGILLQPYPILVITLFGFFLCLVFGLISPKEGFACFGQNVIWLIAFASIAAKAFVKTNLGKRLACFFIQKTGHSSLTLAYGLTLSELALSPMIPSNTARASCVSIPLTVSISESLGSNIKNRTEDVVGRFLSLCSLHANQLSCAIFLTAMASNPMVQKFMADLGVCISWIEWFIIASVPGFICIFLMPWILYKLSPPKLKCIENADEIASTQLIAMPAMSKSEWTTMLVFLGMLICWIFGDMIGISTSVVALGGLCVLLATNVLDVDDIVGAKDIWNIFLWLSILNVMASKLTEYGIIQHYSAILRNNLSGIEWPIAFFVISFTYYFARYLIPGNVLHACAMFPSFAQLLIECGVPAKMGCMMLSCMTAFCGFVTPYASSPCPLFFNTGYIEQRLWWKIGFVTTVIYLIIWMVCGGLWWKILGLW
jgi:DASS family divalent anion:Na+ symporter